MWPRPTPTIRRSTNESGIVDHEGRGLGGVAADFDEDGKIHLVVANNATENTYDHNLGNLKFEEIAFQAGVACNAEGAFQAGMGIATGDLDNDGRIDILIVSQNSPLAYFHNKTEGAHAVTLLLEGTASNRDAVGARITLLSGGRKRIAQRTGGGSYLSASDPRLHFGLAANRRVVAIEVQWPSGRRDSYKNLPADLGYRLREGDSIPKHLAGFALPPQRDTAPERKPRNDF